MMVAGEQKSFLSQLKQAKVFRPQRRDFDFDECVSSDDD
jgi:hypothetical protein